MIFEDVYTIVKYLFIFILPMIQLDVTLTMPSPILAVYSSLVAHLGSNLAFINATYYEVQPLDEDIGNLDN